MERSSWQQIRDRIGRAIASGELPPGGQLPTEVELCRRFAAGRHSVRRAVQALAMEGKLRVEQGRGTFVAGQPRLTYRIGRRTRFRENLSAQGIAPSTELVGIDVLPAPASVADCLGLAEDEPVVRVTRRGLADGAPISIGVAWNAVARLPRLAGMVQKGLGMTDIYASHGIADYLRRSTVVSARAAAPSEAALLRLHPATPVLVASKLDVLPDGTPLGWAESIWSSGLVQFGIEFDDEEAGAERTASGTAGEVSSSDAADAAASASETPRDRVHPGPPPDEDRA